VSVRVIDPADIGWTISREWLSLPRWWRRKPMWEILSSPPDIDAQIDDLSVVTAIIVAVAVVTAFAFLLALIVPLTFLLVGIVVAALALVGRVFSCRH